MFQLLQFRKVTRISYPTVAAHFFRSGYPEGDPEGPPPGMDHEDYPKEGPNSGSDREGTDSPPGTSRGCGGADAGAKATTVVVVCTTTLEV